MQAMTHCILVDVPCPPALPSLSLGHPHLLQHQAHVTVRESVLFIGTQFSILYTFMYSPA
jgi:hypothetical protein